MKEKEEFDWDELDQFLKDWENFDKVKDEFCDEITVSAAVFYVRFYDNYHITDDEFIEKCKKETKYIAEDFFYLLSDLLHHYEEKTENFLDFEDISIYKPKPMNFEELKKMPEQYPHVTEEYVQNVIKEEEEAFAEKKAYLEGFHKLIKKEITDYLYNMDKLPARAFRELDFICYQKMDDFELFNPQEFLEGLFAKE